MTSTYIPAPARYAGLWRPDTAYAAGTLVHYGEGGLYAATAPIPKLHRYLEDMFQRYQRNGWGTSSSGAAWTPQSMPDATKAALSVHDGAGHITYQADGSLDGAGNSDGWLSWGTTPADNVDVLMTFSVASTALNPNEVDNPGADYSNIGLSLVLSSDAAWSVARPEMDMGWSTLNSRWEGGFFVFGLSDSDDELFNLSTPALVAGRPYRLRLRHSGEQYLLRLWVDGDPEPSDWGVEFDSEAGADDPGRSVLLSWYPSAAPNQVISVSHIVVQDIALTPDNDARWEALP